jgi:hypothetical protein
LPTANGGWGAIFIGEPSLEKTIQPQTRFPTLAADSSSPLITASTPGIVIALEALIRFIFACA